MTREGPHGPWVDPGSQCPYRLYDREGSSCRVAFSFDCPLVVKVTSDKLSPDLNPDPSHRMSWRRTHPVLIYQNRRFGTPPSLRSWPSFFHTEVQSLSRPDGIFRGSQFLCVSSALVSSTGRIPRTFLSCGRPLFLVGASKSREYNFCPCTTFIW